MCEIVGDAARQTFGPSLGHTHILRNHYSLKAIEISTMRKLNGGDGQCNRRATHNVPRLRPATITH